MALYETIYTRKCRSLIHWDKMGEQKYIGPNLITISFKAIEEIHQRIQAAQSRQKSCADIRCEGF